jgi:hypothetical protein
MSSKSIYTNQTNISLSEVFSLDYTEHESIDTSSVSEAYYGKRGHPFFGQKHTDEWRKLQSDRTSECKWVNDGVNESFVDKHEAYIERGWSYGRIIPDEHKAKLAKSGTQNLFKAREGYMKAVKGLVESGKHPSQAQWSCIHCGKSGKGKMNFTRYHGVSCKEYT